MMSRAILFLLLAPLLLPLFVHAQSASELQSQIDSHNAQILSLQAEIAQYQSQLDTIGKQKNTLQGAIDTLTLSQKKLAAQISVTQNKISSANLELQRLGSQIGDKESLIAANEVAIGKALREVAQDEQISVVAKIFSADSFGQAWAAAEQSAEFSRALGEDVAALTNAKIELADNRDKVAATKTQLISLQNDLSLQKKSVDLNKTAQQKLLADTKNQESAYQKLLAAKKAEEASFEATLFELQSKLQYVLDPSKIPPAGKGVLRWPLDDVFITQLFGRTSSSGRLYTSGTHNGVDFRAAFGTPVHAALSGTVLEVNYGAVQNCQYGKWILIKHPNGLATLYAHLSDISVTKGSVVVTGQVIGFSGNTGYATGPHLHLGVYLAEAISFKQYRCNSGANVLIPIAPINAYLDPMVYL